MLGYIAPLQHSKPSVKSFSHTHLVLIIRVVNNMVGPHLGHVVSNSEEDGKLSHHLHSPQKP